MSEERDKSAEELRKERVSAGETPAQTEGDTTTCPECGGSGSIEQNKSCPNCGGTGRIRAAGY